MVKWIYFAYTKGIEKAAFFCITYKKTFTKENRHILFFRYFNVILFASTLETLATATKDNANEYVYCCIHFGHTQKSLQ